MPSAEELANALAVELGERHIGAEVSASGYDYVCSAVVNNVPVDVHFGSETEDGDVWWQANIDVERIFSGDVTPSELAEHVIDTFINPA